MTTPTPPVPVASIDDLALYLNEELEEPRAQFILDLAHEECRTVVDPLPPEARGVVLDVAQRGYANPTSVRNADLGLYSEGQGPYSDGTPGVTSGGIWLTSWNTSALQRLAKTSRGAFSVDLLAGYCPPPLPVWDVNTSEEQMIEP